ncbi:ArsR family transcriptional regulator [Gryllotalpicola reticulitermitis]|uniref:ArsR family transcriptional regulator n=1 Tax=Gryllotalpicola reticulitermitis TaxID=1184153 RepID=A0ABV8Q935_9MICO
MAVSEQDSVVPEGVARLKEAINADSRLLVLRQLLRQPQTFNQLVAAVDASPAGCRQALDALERAGYIVPDAPGAGTRKRPNTVFSGVREAVAADLGELVRFLAS